MNSILTNKEAINTVINYAGLQNDNPHCIKVTCNEDMYEITLRTIFQHYDFYVDIVTGEVLGLNAEPILDMEEAYSRVAA